MQIIGGNQMFEEKIKELREKIIAGEAEQEQLATEMRSLLEGDASEEKIKEAKAKKVKRDLAKAELTELRETLALYEEQKKGNSKKVEGGTRGTSQDQEYREALNTFIRTKGAQTDGLTMIEKDEALVPERFWRANDLVVDGIIKEDTKAVTSEEISYIPAREIQTVVNLKLFARIHKAKKGSGKYPILKRATTRMYSVEELEKNPKLTKPDFDHVDWSVVTYRGAIPLSQESIDDADVDLVNLVAENNEEISLNTTNYAMSEAFKKFPKKTISGLDDIKKIYNVDLDPAYRKVFVASQSFYNFLDTIKDGNGRYMLQDSIHSASGKAFGGYPFFVVGDELLGEAGQANAFLGDPKRGILFADRKQLAVRWANHEIHGQYLQAVLRFDVQIADKNAGFFLSYDGDKAEEVPKP